MAHPRIYTGPERGEPRSDGFNGTGYLYALLVRRVPACSRLWARFPPARAIGVLAIATAGCGGAASLTTASPVTLPAPWCAAGGGIGAPNRPLAAAEEDLARDRLRNDPVIIGLASQWHIVGVGPFSDACPGEEQRLVGAVIRVQFDEPEDVSWVEDAIVCINGEAQPTRFDLNWTGIRGAAALVPLPSGEIRWAPVPPSLGHPQGRLTRTTRSTLGPRGGPCPARTSND